MGGGFERINETEKKLHFSLLVSFHETVHRCWVEEGNWPGTDMLWLCKAAPRGDPDALSLCLWKDMSTDQRPRDV